MATEMEAAMTVILKLITEKTASHEAMQLTQAALNLAHTEQVLTQVKYSRGPLLRGP